MARFLTLTWHDEFSPEEVFMLGLLDPGKDSNREISKQKMLELQRRINLREHFSLTEDKIVFYRHCRANDLPTPRIHAIFGERGAMETTLYHVRGEDEWRRFCGSYAHRDMVLKPVSGVHGQGVLILETSVRGFTDSAGRAYDASDLLTHMHESGYEQWLVQERLHGHEQLRVLSGTNYLQTARVVTYVDDQGRAAVVGARLRIIAAATPYDNFNFGASGNLVAAIEPERGTLSATFVMSQDALGIVPIALHPVTGVSLEGFAVPDWHRIVALVERAARCFSPLRTIGWDVGITDSGPSLIEGNVTWDPLPGDASFRVFYDQVQSSLT